MTFHPPNSYFSRFPAAAPPAWFPLSPAQRNTGVHPAKTLHPGINSSSTTCQRDEISLSRRGDTVLHIAVPSSLGGSCGVLKAGERIAKDRGTGEEEQKLKPECLLAKRP